MLAKKLGEKKGYEISACFKLFKILSNTGFGRLYEIDRSMERKTAS